jgi:hypothetical protein
MTVFRHEADGALKRSLTIRLELARSNAIGAHEQRSRRQRVAI